MLKFLTDWIIDHGLDIFTADILARGLIFVLIIILSLITFFLTKNLILKGLASIISRTETRWDDVVQRKKVFYHLAHLAPAIVLYISLPVPFAGYDWLISLSNVLVSIYMIGVGILALNALLNASLAIYTKFEVSNRIPIKSFIQVLKIIIYFTSGILIISILLNRLVLLGQFGGKIDALSTTRSLF